MLYQFIENLKQKKLPPTIIETGTYKGQSTREFSKLFNEVLTIELSKELSEIAKQNNVDCKNITYFVGESSKLLESVVSGVTTSYMLFLDAHGSGGDTVFSPNIGRFGSPVLEELDAVKAKLPSILAVDDLSDFTAIESYPKPQIIIEKLLQIGYKNENIYTINVGKGWLVAEL